MTNNIATTADKSLQTILGNPFITSPVQFDMTQVAPGEVTLAAPFMDSRKTVTSNTNTNVSGSVVSNPDIVGANAQVIPCKGVYNKNTTQRLLVKAVGPSGQPVSKTIDFYPIFGSNGQAVRGVGSASNQNLGMAISDGLLAPSEDSASAKATVFPLLVGPQSAVFAQMDSSTLNDLRQLEGFSFSNVFDIAKKVVPVVAKAGYDIYSELSSTDSQQATHDDVGGFLDALGSVAKVAGPIAGAILTAI